MVVGSIITSIILVHSKIYILMFFQQNFQTQIRWQVLKLWLRSVCSSRAELLEFVREIIDLKHDFMI